MLEGGGGEGRPGRALHEGCCHVANRPERFFAVLDDCIRFFLFFWLYDGRRCEFFFFLRFEIGGDDEKSLWLECAYLTLAFHNDAQGRRLHAACRETVAHLFPYQARKVVAYQSVQNPPPPLGRGGGFCFFPPVF